MATIDYKVIKNFFSKEELKVVDVYCQQKLDQIYTGGPYDGYMDGQTFSPSWYRDALTTAFLEAKIPLIEKEMNIKKDLIERSNEFISFEKLTIKPS